MEEGWRVHLSSSEATASDYEEVSQNVGIQRQFRSLYVGTRTQNSNDGRWSHLEAWSLWGPMSEPVKVGWMGKVTI